MLLGDLSILRHHNWEGAGSGQWWRRILYRVKDRNTVEKHNDEGRRGVWDRRNNDSLRWLLVRSLSKYRTYKFGTIYHLKLPGRVLRNWVANCAVCSIRASVKISTRVDKGVTFFLILLFFPLKIAPKTLFLQGNSRFGRLQIAKVFAFGGLSTHHILS